MNCENCDGRTDTNYFYTIAKIRNQWTRFIFCSNKCLKEYKIKDVYI